MSKLTKEQKKLIEERLASPYGRVEFLIDGHVVTARVEPYRVRRWVIVVYVDGWLKADYLQAGCDMQKRFYRLIKKSIYTHKQKAEFIKEFGVRSANKHFDLNKARYYATPTWTSVKAMLRHFDTNNQSIQLTKPLEVHSGAAT